MELENKKWMIKVRLAHFKRLSSKLTTLENHEKEMLIKIKQLLLEDGVTEETINQEIFEYNKLNEEERKKQIDEKVEVLVSQIVTYLEDIEEINSKDYPELYHRIQEILALNTDGNELISQAFERENISHCMNCSGAIYGGPCTYYFSKKLSYKI